MNDKQEEKISVLMPAYNSEEFIDEAISSIVSQTYSNWELLIHDDNSEDDTLKKALEWRKTDKRINVSRNYQEHGHFIDMCNDQLAEADGFYVARLDSDDIATPDRLAREIELFESNRFERIVALGALAIEIIKIENSWAEHHSEWLEEYIKPVASYNEPINYKLSDFNRVIHSTFFARTQDVAAVGGYDYIDPLEDYDLMLKLSKTGNIFVVPENLAIKRKHESNYSKIAKQKLGVALMRLSLRHDIIQIK